MSVRLTELNPEWRELSDKGRCLLFDCPVHRSHSLAVPSAKWTIIGDDFETLSITPSINVEGCWHGFVTNGEVR